MTDFLTSYIGHLENTGSLSYANLPNVDTFHYAIQKIITFLMSPLISENLSVTDTSFPKFEFLLNRQNFIIGNKYIGCFP